MSNIDPVVADAESQKGYTLTEAVLLVALIASLSVALFLFWAMIHFIVKFW